MAILIPIKEVKVNDFRDFCNHFNIKTKKNAGDDGSDEELILEELIKIEKEKWLLNYIDDRIDGYFRLQLLP